MRQVWDAAKKVGSFLGSGMMSEEQKDKLCHQADRGEALARMVATDDYKGGLAIILRKRREKAIADMRSDKGRTALDEIEELVEQIKTEIESGRRASAQLEKLKETSNG